jgi:hypothetical protein
MSNRLDNNADGTSQESPTSVAPAQDVTDSAKDPDMDDWRKTFGHNIPVAVKEFLKKSSPRVGVGDGS